MDAGADDVFPGVLSAAVAGDDMVQGKLSTFFTAVLAGVVIAFVDVVAGELDLAPRDPVEEEDDDHARDADRATCRGPGHARVFCRSR